MSIRNVRYEFAEEASYPHPHSCGNFFNRVYTINIKYKKIKYKNYQF